MRPRAYLVVGPESSGTRMLTEALVSAGVWGNAGHEQRLDLIGFGGVRDRSVVLRRSVPHAGQMPPIAGLVREAWDAGYSPVLLPVLRDPEITARSQVAHGHQKGLETARKAVDDEYSYIARQMLSALPCEVQVVPYSAFAHSGPFRAWLFQALGLDAPCGTYDNRNLKYLKEDP